jgi:hypothetical protein
VKFSDKLICLSDRDSGVLRVIYGRGASDIFPMALEDKNNNYYAPETHCNLNNYALFVGGTFYANRAGISWFVKEVVPLIDIPVVIVGKGFEMFRSQLEIPGKVLVVGTVVNLSGLVSESTVCHRSDFRWVRNENKGSRSSYVWKEDHRNPRGLLWLFRNH